MFYHQAATATICFMRFGLASYDTTRWNLSLASGRCPHEYEFRITRVMLSGFFFLRHEQPLGSRNEKARSKKSELLSRNIQVMIRTLRQSKSEIHLIAREMRAYNGLGSAHGSSRNALRIFYRFNARNVRRKSWLTSSPPNYI
jgi:hypothetical protein